MAQQLSVLTEFGESLSSVSSTASLYLQPHINPDAGNPVPFGIHGYIYAHGTHKHTHTFLNIEIILHKTSRFFIVKGGEKLNYTEEEVKHYLGHRHIHLC